MWTRELVYRRVSLKAGEWSHCISMQESNTNRAAPSPRLFMQIPTGILSRLLQRDMNLYHMSINTRGNIIHILLTRLAACCSPTHQKRGKKEKKLCRTLLSLQEVGCLFMEIWYACVSPAYFSFSSVFCLPGIHSRMSRLPSIVHFSRYYFHLCPSHHCFACKYRLNSLLHVYRCKMNPVSYITAMVTRADHY